MSEIYGNAMTNELSSSADFRFGPIPADRTSTGSRLRRFHPYMGCNLSRQRNVYGGNVGTDYLPGLYFGNNFSTGTEQGSYLSGYSHTLGAGAFLTNALCQQDLLAFNIGVQQRSYQQPYDMKVLQNLCSPEAQTETNYPISSSKVGKDRGHPFYSRRRAEPAEGMTRTKEKYRVVYTDKQRKGLEEEYNTNKFITTERKAEISGKLGLSVRQIKIWFQNRRAKERRDFIKGKDTEQTEHSTEDNNNIDDHSQNSLAHANFSTSCRFSGSEAQPEERLYSSGQCRFMNNSELGGTSSNILSSSNANLLKTRDSESLRHSVSPSEWSTSAENNFIPYLDVSPLTGNVNFNFGQRL